jgi:hypothetical protein
MTKINKNEDPMNVTALRPADIERYVACGGVRCPFCLDHDIVGEEVEVDEGTVRQAIQCNNCDAEWTDVYKPADIIVSVAPTQPEPEADNG